MAGKIQAIGVFAQSGVSACGSATGLGAFAMTTPDEAVAIELPKLRELPQIEPGPGRATVQEFQAVAREEPA